MYRCTSYLPWNCGGRFSAKAIMASARSADLRKAAFQRATNSSPSSVLWFVEAISTALVPCTANGELEAI